MSDRGHFAILAVALIIVISAGAALWVRHTNVRLSDRLNRLEFKLTTFQQDLERALGQARSELSSQIEQSADLQINKTDEALTRHNALLRAFLDRALGPFDRSVIAENNLILGFIEGTGASEVFMEALAPAFTRPIVARDNLVTKPIQTMSELVAAIHELETVPNSAYFEIYKDIAVSDGVVRREGYVEVPFTARQFSGRAFAYFQPARTNANKCAVLLIPGSGHNQSSEIVAATGYHGNIATRLRAYCDVYVQIKPNDDIRAIHNGERKLDELMLINGLLRNGFSYSATYLSEAMALQRHLAAQYTSVGVAGLSQGGEAAFMLSLQADFNFAIVASGFSIMQVASYYGGTDQILIPALNSTYAPDRLRSLVGDKRTRYLFSWGKQDDSNLYRVEAAHGMSCRFLKTILKDRTECVAHDAGHVFPARSVETFVAKSVQARPASVASSKARR